jgi:hypothetical protein
MFEERGRSATTAMRTWTYPAGDRPAGAGPWADEPDKAQWVDEATGLDCLIVRQHAGALCGYVGVPPGHRLHGVGYPEVEDVSVHGGLTFSATCDEDADEGRGICHIPEPGRPADVWWLGFDCAHAGDLMPRYAETLTELGGPDLFEGYVYRNFDYVRSEVTRLAEQIGSRGD